MSVIMNNMAAMNTKRQLNINTKKNEKTSEKLSSGYRINRASDDAAGLTISEKMRWQIRGLNRGLDNTSDGISWIQVGDGAMGELQSIVHRVRELAVQASNDTNTESDREALNNEIQQLKKEINKIGQDTEFNTKKVFDNSFVYMGIEGIPQDMNIFNASYDESTGEVSYGGILFHGNRIKWDDIDTGMVTTDGNGQQIFNEGTYSYTDNNGNKFQIKCADGAKVPEITREIEITADGTGVTVDGMHFGWSSLKDESGRPASAGNVHSGGWELEYGDATLNFYVPYDVSTLNELADAINSCNNGKVTYTWTENYVGSKSETAVDVKMVNNLNVSNELANLLSSSSLSYTMRADDTGIWIDDGNGGELSGSKKTWADLGITSWDTGADIVADKTYTYEYSDAGANDVFMSFDFVLSDVTSLDSVVDGIDNMVIDGKNIKTSYETELDITLDDNITKATASAANIITFEEEKALGRDFDQKAVDDVGSETVQYDRNTGDIVLDFKDGSGNSVLEYTGTVLDSEANKLQGDLETYLNYVLKEKQAAALAGEDPQSVQLGTGDLFKLVGSGNITSSGYFDDVVTVDTTGMVMTDGSGWAKPGNNGSTYPTAYIDFQDLFNTYTLSSLVGLGFNSTCKTCSNHYSILFTNNLTDVEITSSGYEYEMKRQGNHYTLQIDINSLGGNGVATAEDFTKALVEITGDCYDFHYTQYAADGSKFYIYDNRTQGTGTTAATFDTRPYQAIDTDEFNFELSADDGRKVKLNYSYDFGDFADNVVVEMTQDNAGEYIKLDAGIYVKYDSVTHAGIDESKRHNMTVTYTDNAGNVLADSAAAVEEYKQGAFEKMFTNTTVNLNATDYTRMTLAGDENSNVAIRSLFDSEIVEDSNDNGIHVQHSSRQGDATVIPRFAMNTAVLGMTSANVLTFEAAQKTISSVDYALEILSDRRSTYGAYQNRLEYTYASNANTSENTQAAESKLRDADMADEMVEYSKNNILMQAGQAILAQAHQSEQGILNLLRM